ncbi:hypothetical protein ACVWYQ_007647 [Bradyrhizobium sp. USDA 3397]
MNGVSESSKSPDPYLQQDYRIWEFFPAAILRDAHVRRAPQDEGGVRGSNFNEH